MRKINRVFIHCSASDNPAHDDVSVIKQWHLARGFNDTGYHYYIKKDGTIQKGRPLSKTPAAQKGHNTGTIAICLGGLDHFTQAQFNALRELCNELDKKFKVTFHGHREVSNKTCPNFDYRGIVGIDLEGNLKRVCVPKIWWWQRAFA